MGILVFLITSVIQLLVASFGFVVLLLALNGYSERFATPGIIVYTLISIIIVLGLASIATLVARIIVNKKHLSNLAAGSLSALGFSIVGGVLLVAVFFVSIGTAELLRTLR
jgi:hypothetical protein